jgi:hypothetical protein
MKQLQHTYEMSETLKTYICNIEEERLGQPIPTIGVGSGIEPRHLSTTSTGHARRCPWLGRGRPDAPRQVRPNGHGRVSSMPNGDRQRTNDEGANDTGGCHTCEWRWERGARDAAGNGGKGTAQQPNQRALGKGRTDTRVTDGHPCWIIIEN